MIGHTQLLTKTRLFVRGTPGSSLVFAVREARERLGELLDSRPLRGLDSFTTLTWGFARRAELSSKVVYEQISGGVFLMSLFDEPSTLLLRRNTPWRKIT